jgi:hypothetical protein
VTSDPYAAPEWHVTVPGAAQPWTPPDPAVRWPHDAWVFGVTTALVVLLGAVAGLIWAAVAPKLSIAAVLAGHEEPFRAQIGADAWFLLVSALAGVVTALIATVFRADGPATTAALGIGGTAAAFVAARVGYLAQHADVLSALRAVGLDPADLSLELVDFRLRATGVIVAWPIAALLVHTCAVALRRQR